MVFGVPWEVIKPFLWFILLIAGVYLGRGVIWLIFKIRNP